MAKQQGQFPLKGTLGDVSFYYDKDHGPLARMKGGPSRRQVKEGANYALTRLNNEEFGRASRYGRIIRECFGYLVRRCNNRRLNTSLVTRIKEIIAMDKDSVWGKRDLRQDTLASLTHFELDGNNLSKQYFTGPVATTAGNGCLEVTAAITLDRKPEGICKWRVVSISAPIDFRENHQHGADMQESELQDFVKGEYALSFTHYYDETRMLFHGIAIVFYAYDAVNDRYVIADKRGVNSGFVRFVEKACNDK